MIIHFTMSCYQKMTLYALMGQEKYIQNQESYVIYIQEWRIKKTFGP